MMGADAIEEILAAMTDLSGLLGKNGLRWLWMPHLMPMTTDQSADAKDELATMFRFVRCHFLEHLRRTGIAIAQIIRKREVNAFILLFRRNDRQYLARGGLGKGFHEISPATGPAAWLLRVLPKCISSHMAWSSKISVRTSFSNFSIVTFPVKR